MGKGVPVRLTDITEKVLAFVSKKYNCDNIKAETASMENFKSLTGTEAKTKHEEQVLKEVSLWAATLNITEPGKLQLLSAMVNTKPKDVYAYQQLLLSFFEEK